MGRDEAALQISALSKRFGDVVALEHADLHLATGSFHALLGENGAGKSTLARCVIGLVQPDAGRIEIDARERRIGSPKEAHDWGVGMVHQHFSLVPNMTVAENLVTSKFTGSWIIDWRREVRDLDDFCSHMPFTVDLSARVSSLAAGEKQKVEILKQLFLGHHILILDEPTSVLTLEEADELFGMLRQRTQRGELSVLLITHKLREVFKFAEVVSVLRRGQVVARGSVQEFTSDDLAHHMVGKSGLPTVVARENKTAGRTGLQVRDLVVRSDKGIDAVKGVDLTVRNGEIVGVAGVSGNGQRELLEVLAGQRQATTGSVEVHGTRYHATRHEMLKHGVFFLPEEPLRTASVASMTLAENLAFRGFDQPPLCRRRWVLSRDRMKNQARELVARYRIKAANVDVPIEQLSGGNVQRTVLARELSAGVQVLVASNPCFGLDVGAVAEIHSQIMAARNHGAAVLMVSEDLDELMALSDRIIVMFEGRFVHEVAAADADLQAIGRHMTGGHQAIAS